MSKILKSGAIKDSLFEEMSQDIGDKYKEVGVNLGLSYKYLQNELDTGHSKMLSASKKAQNMLNLWKENAKVCEFTYSVLAGALEKTNLIRCADKFCYIWEANPGIYIIVYAVKLPLQLSLRTKYTLGTGILSSFWRLSLSRRLAIV